MYFEVLPSGANFIFAKHKTRDGAELTEKLREKNIIIRHFKKPTRIAPYLRITIGTEPQNKQFIAALTTILNV
jgi:histidinol-phosphate aminotransferase